MLQEISIKEIPFGPSKESKQTRIPMLKSNQKLSPYSIIYSNYYLEIVVYILYFMPETFSISITLPDGILLGHLPFLPSVQAIYNLFVHHRAIIDNNSIVSQIDVRGLLPETIEVVENMDKSNKIDPFIKQLFKNAEPKPNDLNTTRAYAIIKNGELSQSPFLSNLQKYLIWECMRNDGIYGLPIGPISLNNFEDKSFQEFIQVFENTYIAGSGQPWLSSHLIISGINRSIIDGCIEHKR